MPNQFLSPDGDLENYFLTEYYLIDQWIGDRLWIWGRNQYGQLGVNDTPTNRSTPVTTFIGGTNWKQIDMGFGHAAGIKTNGTLWVWGNNASGQLGTNDTTQVVTPITTFAGGTNWKQVVCGYRITAAIKTDGTLWTWGFGSFGQLGINNTSASILTPVTTFAGGTNWNDVSLPKIAGSRHSAAVKSDGTLWTWGSPVYGRLGDNQTATSKLTPITTFAGGTNWRQVSCGNRHNAAIKTDGTLWTWGGSSYGQLGDNQFVTDKLTPVTTFSGQIGWNQVSCGGYFTVAIKSNRTLWTWGNNGNGQLGDNTSTNRLTPITTLVGGTNWKQVSGGGYHTAAVKTDGTLWVWGRNVESQLGINDITSRSTPVTIFPGGTSWKQSVCGNRTTIALTVGLSPELPLS